MPPPIRYPLPSLIAAMLLGVLVWQGAALTRPLRSAIAARWSRAVEGPPIPHSDHPQVVVGPITRRALLLTDDVPASAMPGGPATEKISHRMFVDVYDVWPLRGEPNFYRVGIRRPMGWVKASDVLPWDTRLVVRLGGSSSLPGIACPVVSWDGEHATVAVWPAGKPWGSSVGERRRIPWRDLSLERCGVWFSREELLETLRMLGRAMSQSSADALRIRAVLGRVLDDRPITDVDLAAAKTALPRVVLAEDRPAPDVARERLAVVNEQWEAEASWAGISFRLIPLSALP